MGATAYVQSSFLGGEWSKTSQGRMDRPDYRTAMNRSSNQLPIEAGASVRRPGTRNAGTTRSGVAGRQIGFAFRSDNPYMMEFTDSHLRFREDGVLVTSNDNAAVTSISSANPAVVLVGTAVTWATGDQVYFNNLTKATPLLLRRVFTWTKVDTTHGSLTDATTGATIDGSTLGTLAGGVTVSRVLDFVTPYTAGSWSNVRSVQAEKKAVFLSGTSPQVLSVVTAPTSSAYATFTLTAANFTDGPYLDPPTNGVRVTPGGVTGIVALTVDFPAWSATHAYAVGDYVTSAGVNYVSIVDQNLNITPAGNPASWTATSAGAAINDGAGFTGSDVGRHIRLYSEPALWAIGVSYTVGNVIGYLNSLGGVAYYTCLTAHTSTAARAPGISLSDWGINPAGALWTWGKITSLSNLISGTLAGSTNIGDMTTSGGLAAGFDGVTSKQGSLAAEKRTSGSGSSFGVDAMIGKDYHLASDQVIASCTVFPSSDFGFVAISAGNNPQMVTPFTIDLRASNTSPAGNPTAGTIIGTVSVPLGTPLNQPLTITSTSTAAWKYVWVDLNFTGTNIASGPNWVVEVFAAQVEFFGTTGTGSSAGVNVQLLGQNLLYTTPIRTWRLGLFSSATGFPTCGTYHEGRLWLSGIVGNRVDASVPNDIFNFAPTASDGTVSAASAIDYTFDGPDVNTIFWMEPDQQGIICGTQAGEWLIQATNANLPLTVETMQAHRVTKIGCANIEPRRTEHTLVFAQKHQRKLMEYFADVYSGKFSAPNLAWNAKHLTKRVVAELAYQQELAPIIWARCNDGSLLGCTYKRDSLLSAQGPTFSAWHQHTLGSARTVESLAVGPSHGGTVDTLTLVTNDASGIRHVEQVVDLFEEGSDLTDAWFLDNAVAPTDYEVVTSLGNSVLRMYGLWHLNTKTVTVFAGGLDCGEVTVANGQADVLLNRANVLLTSAFITAFAGAMPIVVGFTYTSQAQLVRPANPVDSGVRGGGVASALGKTRRSDTVAVMLLDTQGISFGTSFDAGRLNAALLKTTGGSTLLAANALFSGVLWQPLTDDYSLDSMLCWQISRPFPATICAVGANVQTQG